MAIIVPGVVDRRNEPRIHKGALTPLIVLMSRPQRLVAVHVRCEHVALKMMNDGIIKLRLSTNPV